MTQRSLLASKLRSEVIQVYTQGQRQRDHGSPGVGNHFWHQLNSRKRWKAGQGCYSKCTGPAAVAVIRPWRRGQKAPWWGMLTSLLYQEHRNWEAEIREDERGQTQWVTEHCLGFAEGDMWGILMLNQDLWGKELTLYSHLDWRRHYLSSSIPIWRLTERTDKWVFLASDSWVSSPSSL